ncbi:hypothetical protein M1271_07075 [Patescibacteria group bacterium]|nr:hypothetical protein [Patescibacteria group bacterium]
MEILLIGFIIVLFLFLNGLPLIVGMINTPKGSQFLGTVHWPPDYFYYLSQFFQGKGNWFASYDLFTGDFISKTFVGWVNVFLGHVFSLLGIGSVAAYQISIVIFAVILLIASYLLIREIFPGSASKRVAAFLFFVTSNAFPKIVESGGKLTFSYFDYWYNTGLPFNRLGGVPHHFIARAGITLAILLAVWWWKRLGKYRFDKKSISKYIIAFLLSGFILASVEPVQWGITVGVLGIVAFLIFVMPNLFLHPDKTMKETLKEIPKRVQDDTSVSLTDTLASVWGGKSFFLPSVLLLIGGLPMAVYLKRTFSTLPFIQLALWENSQQLHISFMTYILANGSVVAVAILGVVFFVRKMDLARLTAFVFTFVTIFLFFSPIPALVSVVNVRFLPATTTLFLSCMATAGIFTVASRFSEAKNIVFLLLTLSIIIIMLPTYYIQLQDRVKVDPAFGLIYLPQKVLVSYQKAQVISTPSDTFMAVYPFNLSLPAIAGRRVFEGHELLTINDGKKMGEANDFFAGKITSEKMDSFLHKNNIHYLFIYSTEKEFASMPFLKKVYDNEMVAIYKVN